MKIHCLKLKNKELNKEVAFYLTSIIRQALKILNIKIKYLAQYCQISKLNYR